MYIHICVYIYICIHIPPCGATPSVLQAVLASEKADDFARKNGLRKLGDSEAAAAKMARGPGAGPAGPAVKFS